MDRKGKEMKGNEKNMGRTCKQNERTMKGIESKDPLKKTKLYDLREGAGRGGSSAR